jgi:hypothetical protein
MFQRPQAFRPGRIRTLARTGLVLGSLIAAGTAVMAGSANAATITQAHSAAATRADACGEIGPLFFPRGDGVLMVEPGSGLHVVAIAWTIATYPTAVGYVEAWDAFPGQHYRSLLESPLNTLYPDQVSSFAVGLGYDFSTRQYTPELIYNSCTWTAKFDPIS